MIVDAELELATAQAITGDAASENVIDLVAAGYNACPNLHLVIRVGDAFDNLTSLTIQVYTDSDATVTDGTLVVSNDIALASLTADTIVWKQRLPEGALLQYLGLNFDVQGTNPANGTIDAFLVNDIDNTIAQIA